MAKAKKGTVKAPKQRLVKSAKVSGNILTLVYEDGTEETFIINGSLTIGNSSKSTKDEDEEDEDDEEEDEDDE